MAFKVRYTVELVGTATVQGDDEGEARTDFATLTLDDLVSLAHVERLAVGYVDEADDDDEDDF